MRSRGALVRPASSVRREYLGSHLSQWEAARERSDRFAVGGHYQPPSPSTTSKADGSFELNLWARGRMVIEVKHSSGLETSRYPRVSTSKT